MEKYQEFQDKEGNSWIVNGKGQKMRKEVFEQKQHIAQSQQARQSQRQSPPKKRRTQEKQQVQANLQMADDTWERLFRALERFEMVTDDIKPEQSAVRQNFHRHQNEMPESVYDAELEVHLQIKAFSYVVAPVRGDKKTVPWLLRDFICWLGGREKVNPSLGPTDRYTIPVIKCILGEQPLNLPKIQPVPNTSLSPESEVPEKKADNQKLSEQEMQKTVEQIGTGLTEGDNIIEDFAQNPDKQATQHSHLRGSLQDGKVRLEKTATAASGQEQWLNRFFNEYWVNLEAIGG